MKGWWELEVGLPSKWVFDVNDDIKCEVIFESNAGKVIKIVPTNERILIDDLIIFVEIILETNKKIADKEKQFTDRMDQMKNALEKEAKRFYEELDELKENSFKNININFTKSIKKEPKPKKAKATITDSNLNNDNQSNE